MLLDSMLIRCFCLLMPRKNWNGFCGPLLIFICQSVAQFEFVRFDSVFACWDLVKNENGMIDSFRNWVHFGNVFNLNLDCLRGFLYSAIVGAALTVVGVWLACACWQSEDIVILYQTSTIALRVLLDEGDDLWSQVMFLSEELDRTEFCLFVWVANKRVIWYEARLVLFPLHSDVLLRFFCLIIIALMSSWSPHFGCPELNPLGMCCKV